MNGSTLLEINNITVFFFSSFIDFTYSLLQCIELIVEARYLLRLLI